MDMASSRTIVGIVIGAAVASTIAYIFFVRSDKNVSRASLMIEDGQFQIQNGETKSLPRQNSVVITPKAAVAELPSSVPNNRYKALIPTPVNSYPAKKSYPLNDWSQNKVSAGHLDMVMVDDINLIPPNKHKLTNSDVLKVSGWAGNVFLGMRMRHVVFTVCEIIVGNTLVTAKRPDVIRLAHPNLTTSGWTAWLAVAHLPRCKNPELRAWTVGAVAPVLSPLIGTASLSLPPIGTSKSKSFYNQSSLVKPDQIPPAPAVTLKITAKKASIYKCSSKRCRIIGTLSIGQHSAFIADELADWVLFQLQDVSGWMPRDAFKIVKNRAKK
jgi:hypothetical protein